MAPAWSVAFYDEANGTCPVEDFIESLDAKRQVKVLAIVRLLAEQGPTLPYPYSSQVRGKLRELRTHFGQTSCGCSASGRRPACSSCSQGFAKRTAKTPDGDIATAEARMAEHLKRQEPRR